MSIEYSGSPSIFSQSASTLHDLCFVFHSRSRMMIFLLAIQREISLNQNYWNIFIRSSVGDTNEYWSTSFNGRRRHRESVLVTKLEVRNCVRLVGSFFRMIINALQNLHLQRFNDYTLSYSFFLNLYAISSFTIVHVHIRNSYFLRGFTENPTNCNYRVSLHAVMPSYTRS